MRIRGNRECQSCGNTWSYYETGSVSCPACGSHRSVGLDTERSLHTATEKTLDLAPLRERVDADPVDRLAREAQDRTREFTRGYGFIYDGELRGLDDTYLAAMELNHVAGEIARRMQHGTTEEQYFMELLRADEGYRPAPETVPKSLWAMRGLAYANAVDAYRSDLRTYLKEHSAPATDGPLERLWSHTKRISALQGDVDPVESERLVTVARALGQYLSEGDEADLHLAETRLDALS